MRYALNQRIRELVTRQIVLSTSFATTSAPLRSIARPTGRPRAFPFSVTKPVGTSTGWFEGMPLTIEANLNL